MNLVVIGGGKVGYYLVKTLYHSGKYNITMIEKSPERCRFLAEEFDCLVINGDGTDLNTLAQANLEDANVVVAVSGLDQDNLVACQMAKFKFGVKKTIARVNNPKNHEVFKTLGVDASVSSTGLIAQMIEGELSMGQIQTLLTFERGEMVMIEAEIEKGSALIDKMVKEISFPKDSVIVSVLRQGKVIIPRGHTVFHEGDRVVALTLASVKQELSDMLIND